jgi:hypothetical protein
MSLKGKLKVAKAVLYKNRSNIEFVAGLLLEVGGVAYIVSKARPAAEISMKISWKIKDIETNDKEEVWAPGERNKYIRDLIAYTIKEFTKCYGIGFAMEIAGWILSGISHATDRNDLANLSMAMASLSATFAQYRERVIEDQGEEKDQLYFLGPQKVTVEVDKHGNVIQKTEVVEDKNKEINLPPHTIMFDEANPNWEKDPVVNRDFLENHLRWLNQRLEAEDFLWENDIRRDLRAPLVKSGWTSGIFAWKTDPVTGEKIRNYLSLGLEAKNPAAQRFRDGIEPSIILQLNVEDNITDKLLIDLI